MIREQLEGFFGSQSKITELERNQVKFEKIMLDTLENIEALGVAYNSGKEIYSNDALRKSLSEEKHVQIATQIALEKITYSDLQKVNEAYNNLRDMYKEFFKKDAVSAASSKNIVPEEVNFKPSEASSDPLIPFGQGLQKQIAP